ncbi:MAG: NHLP family bacteriocin export ABC transporter peptidase/permease/ATPase subunit [Alphaproteobacteria bacterium]|nr:NHLP family bacteriocin export ABC transporter peptidase/permease/ATPase subunit [Alphaproteobacteria bacterium]MBF0374446.1 NHLP family bacteriocin export ABC transporter peptidase/permease/ATPase subunit [Alphaproteobacteria bacterium]
MAASRRTPTVLQMEAVECGAACLSMVLGHYGRFVPLEELRYRCGVSRDGTKASNLVKAAQHYGLKAKGFRKEPDHLGKLPMPQILFWNFNHFVVLEGIDGRRAVLNDPAAGPRVVDRAELDGAFTGVTLAFEPGPDFVPGGRPPSALDGLRRRLGGSWPAFLFVTLASLGLIVPGLLVPAFTRVFVDHYLIGGLDDWLWPLLGAMLVTALVRGMLTWVQEYNLMRLQAKLALGASARFFWHVLRLPVGFFTQRFGGEIGARVQLNDRLATMIGGDLSLAVLNLLTMLIYAAVMLRYDTVLTLIGVAFALVNLVAMRLVARRLADAHQRLLMDRGQMTGIAMQGLRDMESLKASGLEDAFFGRWAGYHAKIVTVEQALQRRRTILTALPLLLGLCGTAVVLMVGGLRVMDGALTIGMLIAFQLLLNSFSAPVAGLVGVGAQLQETQGCVSRLDDVLGHGLAREFSAPPAAPAIIKLAGRACLETVSFGFIPTEPPLIHDLSLEIEAGARVAVVGGSGSGKSTVGKLLAGLYTPWSGRVLIDGRPLDEIPRVLLRNSVALVDQEIVLFEGSVRDNIALWDPTMPDERVVAAAKDAAIHDVVAGRPDGYDHRVLEAGRNFSGGQRQRLEIARALVGNPTLLVLDEATSALDPGVEQQVMEAIRRRGCACLVIAHRLSTVRDCDEIVVLDRGRVVERGSHASLRQAGGPYSRLIEH